MCPCDAQIVEASIIWFSTVIYILVPCLLVNRLAALCNSKKRSVGKLNAAVEDFANDATGRIQFGAIDDVEEVMQDEEDSNKLGLGSIIGKFKRREIEFRKSELVMNVCDESTSSSN